MSKKRAALKFGAAGAVTALYTVATIRKWQGKVDHSQPISREAVAAVSGTFVILTWAAALA